MATTLRLYAELFPNLGWISLAASFPSPSDSTTRATLAADGITVEVAHHGEVCRLELPLKAASGATNLMTPEYLMAPKHGSTTLTWRISLAPQVRADALALQQSAALWSAIELDAGHGVACRRCGSAIVDHGVLREWKDLPSENWAEMMEFWHCHKPDTHDHHSHSDNTAGKADDESLAARGYGASSAISAQQKVGLVDLTALLFAETDCRSLRVCLNSPVCFGIAMRNKLYSIISFTMGMKKVAQPVIHGAVAWLPIQVP